MCNTSLKTGSSICVIGLLILLLLSVMPALSQSPASQEVPGSVSEGRQQQASERLTKIREALIEQRQKLEERQRQVKAVVGEEDKLALQAEIKGLNESIAKLNASFEQLAIGGIDLDIFTTQPRQEFDWQSELVKITRPLFASLNELTEKPRKIDDLRSQIDRYEERLEVIDKALLSIGTLRAQSLSDPVREKLEVVATIWQQRKNDAENTLESTRFQLAGLQGENVSTLEAVNKALGEFFAGRGLTLGLAILIAILVWGVMRLILRLFQAFAGSGNQKVRTTRNRLVIYGYRILTAILMLLTVMTTFYLRGDVLLLALSILGVAMLILSLRQTLPRYVAETRLLLDAGPVRTGERLIWNGIPMQVKTINMNSILCNPELEGEVRLPLGKLSDLVSRPCGEEPWYPTRPDEYFLLPDNRFGQVQRQTLEIVQAKIGGSPVLFPAAVFQGLNLRNLSREGFRLAVTFGIDYCHQSICLDQVPARFTDALSQMVVDAGMENDLVDILVEFKEAGVSSLDYLIFVNMKGNAASSYLKLGRMVQQTCVDVCNKEDWGIPFTQMTIHQGIGFDTLRTPAD